MQIKQALEYTSANKVLVLNVDDIADVNINKLSEYKKSTVVVANPRLPFGLIERSGERYKFIEKPILRDKIVSIGWYLFYVNEVKGKLPNKGNLEQELLPKLDFDIFFHEGYWLPINTEKERLEAERYILKTTQQS